MEAEVRLVNYDDTRAASLARFCFFFSIARNRDGETDATARHTQMPDMYAERDGPRSVREGRHLCTQTLT
jgi:hypothetical protein